MAYITLCLLVVFCVLEVQMQSGTDVQNLLTQLFETDKYNKKIRPITDQSSSLQIGVDFILTSIIEFDDQEESLKTSGYLSFSWIDAYLQWNPSSYNGVDALLLPQDDIWRPDAALRNAFKSFTGLGSSFLNLRVSSTGEVTWEPFQVLQSTCDVDITYFPFDKQSCDLKFVAWSYSKEEVELNQGSKGILLEEYDPNAVWDIVSTSASETNTYEASVTFTIKMKRKPGYYVINIIIPIILLSVLNVFAFALPVYSGERASYAVTVLLALAVFLTIVSAELPKNSVNVSLLSVYITSMTTLSTVIVILCILQVRLATRNVDDYPVNKFFQTMYKFSMRLQCRKLTCEDKIKPIKTPPQPKPKNKLKLGDAFGADSIPGTITWLKIVSAMDFLLFWLFLLLTFIITLVLFVMCANN